MGTPTVTHVETVAQGDPDGQFYTTGTLSPAQGELWLLFWIARDPLVSGNPAPSNGGTLNMQWEPVAIGSGTPYLDLPTNDARWGCLAAIAPASPGSGAVTLDWSAEDDLRWAGWSIVKCAPSTGTWANVAAAVRQAVAASAADNSPSVTLGTLASSASLSLMFGGSLNDAGGEPDSDPTVGSGFTLLGMDDDTPPGGFILSEYDEGVTALAFNNPEADAWVGLGIEVIDPASGGGGGGTKGTPTVELVDLDTEGTDAQTFTSASFSPAEGELFLLFHVARDSSITGGPTLTNGGTLDLDWEAIDLSAGTVTLNLPSNDVLIGLHAALAGASAGTGAVTMDYSDQDALAAQGYALVKCTPSQGAWASVSEAVRQAVAAGVAELAAAETINLAALEGEESLVLGFWTAVTDAGGTANVPAAGDGFTSLGSNNDATAPGTAVMAEYDAGVTAVTATYSDSDTAWMGIGVEIVDPEVDEEPEEEGSYAHRRYYQRRAA